MLVKVVISDIELNWRESCWHLVIGEILLVEFSTFTLLISRITLCSICQSNESDGLNKSRVTSYLDCEMDDYFVIV